MADDEIDDTDDETGSFSVPAPPDRHGDALDLLVALTKPAEMRKQVLAHRRLERNIAALTEKLDRLNAEVVQRETALAQREAAIDAREAAIARREHEFARSVEEARDELRGYYNEIAEADRHIRYRILSHAGLLDGYTSPLRDLPSWGQLRNLVAGLPDDPPPLEHNVVSRPRIDVFSDVSDDPHADRHGNVFLGSLSRSTSHKATSQ